MLLLDRQVATDILKLYHKLISEKQLKKNELQVELNYYGINENILFEFKNISGNSCSVSMSTILVKKINKALQKLKAKCSDSKCTKKERKYYYQMYTYIFNYYARIKSPKLHEIAALINLKTETLKNKTKDFCYDFCIEFLFVDLNIDYSINERKVI